MTVFKYLLLASGFALSCSALAQGSDIPALTKSLKVWQPTEIAIKNNVTTITFPGNALTSEAYETIITNGICMPIWTKSTPKNFLSNIKEMNLVNQYKAAGFIFENPAQTCEEMGKLMDQPAKTLLASKTRVYMPAK